MGDAGLPIVGHMIEFFRGGPDFVLQLYRKYGPVCTIDSPIIPTVAALGPDATQVGATPTATRTTRSGLGIR